MDQQKKGPGGTNPKDPGQGGSNPNQPDYNRGGQTGGQGDMNRQGGGRPDSGTQNDPTKRPGQGGVDKEEETREGRTGDLDREGAMEEPDRDNRQNREDETAE